MKRPSIVLGSAALLLGSVIVTASLFRRAAPKAEPKSDSPKNNRSTTTKDHRPTSERPAQSSPPLDRKNPEEREIPGAALSPKQLMQRELQRIWLDLGETFTSLLTSADPSPLVTYLRSSHAMKNPLTRVAFIEYACRASVDGNSLMKLIHPGLLQALRSELSDWAFNSRDGLVRRSAAKMLAAIARNSESIEQLGRVADLEDPQTRLGLAEGMALLERDERRLSDELRLKILHMAVSRLSTATSAPEAVAFIAAIRHLERDSETRDGLLLSRNIAGISECAALAITRSLDVTVQHSRQVLVNTANSDTRPSLRAAALARLVEVMQDASVRSCLETRVKTGTAEERFNVLSAIALQNQGPNTAVSPSDLRWVLDILRAAPEDHLRVEAEKVLSHLPK